MHAPATAADLVALLLAIVPPGRHAWVLRQALATQAAARQAWENQHLAYVEQGWEAAWQARHATQTALVAALTRALAAHPDC